MIERLLPEAVVAVETGADLLEAELFPEERAALGNAVEKRRQEFVTGRACARRALETLGFPAVAVGSGDRGEPLWPAGVVGSITHCAGYRACAVARAADVASLGIDAEVHEPLPDGVLESVASERERSRLRAGAGLHMDRLLFSAKEAIYKAWFPLARRWLGFDDVSLTIDPGAGTFDGRLLVPGPGRLKGFSGHFAVEEGIVAAAVVVEPVALGAPAPIAAGEGSA